jgi:hypothetical protein
VRRAGGATRTPLGARKQAPSSSRGGAVDGLLAQQLEMDIEALEQSTRRSFSDAERSEIRGAQQRAYRWTFLVSGLQHPKFTQIVGELTTTGGDKIAAAQALSA